MTDLLKKIKDKFGVLILSVSNALGDETVIVAPENFKNVIQILKNDSEFDFNILADLTAVDYFAERRHERFEVVYHLLSINLKKRLRLKVLIAEGAEIETLTDLWPNADWLEREVWDMFGIQFRGHPGLKRLLIPESFVGHPLRKDYPWDKEQSLIEAGSR